MHKVREEIRTHPEFQGTRAETEMPQMRQYKGRTAHMFFPGCNEHEGLTGRVGKTGPEHVC